MKIYRIILLVCLSLIFSLPNIYADDWQRSSHSKVALFKGSIGSENYVSIKIKLDHNWHIYWHHPGNYGVATDIKTSPEDVIEKIYWPWPILVSEFDKSTSYIYGDETIITLKIKPSQKPKTIKLNYALCRDQCIPLEVNLDLSKALYNQNLIENQLHNYSQNDEDLHVEHAYLDQDKIQLEVISKNPAASLKLIAESNDQILPVISKFTNSHKLKTWFLLDSKSVSPGKIIVNLNDGNKIYRQEIIVKAHPHVIIENSVFNQELIVTMLIAILGGIILNFMPCVLPVISIKLFSLLNKSHLEQKQIKKGFALTIFGILTSFAALALLMILLNRAGQVVGWGFHFQQPYFIISVILVQIFMACNMWGLFEINLDINLLNNNKEKSVYIKDFLNGIFTTLLATPCSAPFIGTAISYALSQNALIIFIIFISMGTGLALPYFILIIKPNLIKLLPKPGRWMLMLRKLLAILLFISVIWLLQVLSAQIGNIPAILLFLICILIKFVISIEEGILHFKKNKILAIFLLVLIAYFIPERSYHNEKIYDKYVNNIWQQFDIGKIKSSVEQGKIVVVDISADWCLSCKFNKMFVLNRVDILNYLNNQKVVAMRADINNIDHRISQYMLQYKRYGIPFNIVYGPKSPNGIVLKEILSSQELIKALHQAGY